jgi:hypothetical protein
VSIQNVFVQEMGWVKTDLGQLLYIRIRREGYGQLSWRDAWEAFRRNYPGQWAVQFFPPAGDLVDDMDIFHLYVFDIGFVPTGVNIHWKE